jgi:hypothetical protein
VTNRVKWREINTDVSAATCPVCHGNAPDFGGTGCIFRGLDTHGTNLRGRSSSNRGNRRIRPTRHRRHRRTAADSQPRSVLIVAELRSEQGVTLLPIGRGILFRAVAACHDVTAGCCTSLLCCLLRPVLAAAIPFSNSFF